MLFIIVYRVPDVSAVAVGGVQHSVVDGNSTCGLGGRRQVCGDVEGVRSPRSGTSPVPFSGVRRPRRHGARGSGAPM